MGFNYEYGEPDSDFDNTGLTPEQREFTHKHAEATSSRQIELLFRLSNQERFEVSACLYQVGILFAKYDNPPAPDSVLVKALRILADALDYANEQVGDYTEGLTKIHDANETSAWDDDERKVS